MWAREISPGRGLAPPPDMPTAEMLWWGERKGRRVMRGRSGSVRPSTEWIWVTSRASSLVMSGRMEGRRLASMDLPEPGGPTIKILCPPAAAISKTRFTCPFTWEKSGPGRGTTVPSQAGAGEMGASPVRWRTSCCTLLTG